MIMAMQGVSEIIRQEWLTTASSVFANDEGELGDIIPRLIHFYDLMIQTSEDGNFGAIEGLLADWLNERKESEVIDPGSELLPLISRLLLITYQTIIKYYNPSEALALLGRLLPFFTHAVNYLATQQTRFEIQEISSELELVKLSINQLEKSKSDFISVAAHELKTPLTLIEGYASMLQDIVPKGESVEQTEIYLKGIKTGTERLREIVDDMIDVSLIDNNMLTLNYQPTWLNRIVSLVRRELNQAIKQRGLSLIIQDYPGSDVMFFADGERLYQAFRNVLANAIKYTPDGGSIVIDGRLLPGFVETIIQDSGIGIAPENQTRIFEKFGRLGSASLHSTGKIKFKGGGPGLGLSITKGIINAHGGTIWVESSGYDEVKCPGSTFHILLPLRKVLPDQGFLDNLGSFLSQ